MNYTQFTQQLSILAEQAISPTYALTDVPDFANSIPSAIAYAEGRIYRDCTFLAQRTQTPIAGLAFTAGSRSLDLSTANPPVMVVEGVAMITPVGDAPVAGTRQPFDMTSLDVIDLMWPTESVTLNPANIQSGRMAAMLDATTLVVAPTPDANYRAEITGLVQPAPLSATNVTTYLSTVYPDLMLTASMIFVSGFLRDYGAQSEDPRTGLSWEGLYNKQLPGVVAEEQRRRTQGTAWSPNMPTPLANPARQ